MNDELWLTEMAEALRAMLRHGNKYDEPEGTRYIQISDTLTNQIADRLEAVAMNLAVERGRSNWPFPGIKAEDVKKRIKELEAECPQPQQTQ